MSSRSPERARRLSDPRYSIVADDGQWLTGDRAWGKRTDAVVFASPLQAARVLAEIVGDVFALDAPMIVEADPARGFPAVLEPCAACEQTGRAQDSLYEMVRRCRSCHGYGERAIWALNVVQLHYGGLFDSRSADGALHLVRNAVNGGCPGPLLCGIDFRAEDGPGYSVGGGVAGPGVNRTSCPACCEQARLLFAGLPVCGLMRGDTIADDVGVAHVDHWLPLGENIIAAKRQAARERRQAREASC